MTILLIVSLIANGVFMVCIWKMLALFQKLRSSLSNLGQLSQIPLMSSANAGQNFENFSPEDLAKVSKELSMFAEQFTTTINQDPQGSDIK